MPTPTSEHRPCLIVPFYNHGQFAVRLVAGLLPHGLPIWVVDDGSAASHHQQLLDVTASNENITVITLTHNQGKGKACITGFHAAAAAGCTHAIQVDADCQHDFSVIPDFVAASRALPAGMICGQPIFDETIPKVRLYSRYLTHYLVWLHTLSFAIRDSMCGLRCYPLQQTLSMLEESPVGFRMDFDIEIAVRLYWAGLPVKNLPVRVIYHDDASSHFRMVLDNLRIVRAHAVLLVGMLWRMPRLLRRGKSA